MKKEVPIVLGLAVLWILGGIVIGFALQALFDVQWVIQCTSLNLIIGMVMLLLVTRNKEMRQLFYEGPKEGEISSPLIGMMWTFPIVMVIVGVLWWLLAQFLR